MIGDFTSQGVPGWFGKIPALGDFATRRLPVDFVDPWDAWLQRSLTASREALGDGWIDVYLHTPIWRFALMPGVCGPSGWAGVLAPSVDRIGRYFPLTMACSVDADVELPAASPASHPWYARLEEVALAALQVDSTVEALEEALKTVAYPSERSELAEASGDSLARWWVEGSSAPRVFAYGELTEIASAIRESPSAAARIVVTGKSLWWSAPAVGEPATMHACTGLPPDEYFVVLMHGGGPAKDETADPSSR